MAVQFSLAVENAILDQVEATIGTTPTLEFFSGALPAATTDADPAGLLVTLTLPSDWAANAAANEKAISGPWTGTIATSGDAASFRIKAGATTHVQGTVSGPNQGGDIELNTVSLIAGRDLTFTSGKLTYVHPSASTEIGPLVVNFTIGVAASVAVTGLPTTADRIIGGHFVAYPGSSDSNGQANLAGVYFDYANNEWVYDGIGIPAAGRSPASNYMIGVENGPYNNHWGTPVAIPTLDPAVVDGRWTMRSLQNAQKHVCAVYCPNDEKIRLCFGDFDSYGVLDVGEQSGRNVIWAWDPIANTWAVDNAPCAGVAGDVVPLSPDIMNVTYLPNTTELYVAWGRWAGLTGGQEWKDRGGVADAYPFTPADVTLANLPTFRYSLSTKKFSIVQGGSPFYSGWGRTGSAYDPTDQRIYSLDGYGVLYQQLKYRDVTTFVSTGWVEPTLTPLPGRYSQYHMSRGLICDDTARLLYYFDLGYGGTAVDRTPPALIGITLPGHAEGPWVTKLLREFPELLGWENLPIQIGGLECWAWIPEQRKIVLFLEPDFTHGGPLSLCFTIDVDTFAVTAGPRLPPRDNGGVYMPSWCVWYPPTQELVVGGWQPGSDEAETESLCHNYHRYAWIDGADNTHPLSPWEWTRVTITCDEPGSTNVIEDVGVDRIIDHNPDPGWTAIYKGSSAAMVGIVAFSGMTYAPPSIYGGQGAIVVHGGGHNDYGGNEVYVYDIATATWDRINEPSTAISETGVVNQVTGAYGDGTPASSHTMTNLSVIPGGTKGQLLLYTIGASYRVTGSYGWGWTCDLATGVWSLFSEDSIGAGAAGPYGSVYDPTRNRVWGIGQDWMINYLDLTTKRFTNVNPTFQPYFWGALLPTCAATLFNDLILVAGHAPGGARIYAVDAATPANVSTLTMIGDPLPSYPAMGMGFDWDTTTNIGYLYIGFQNGSHDVRDSVWQIKPPASNYMTGQWTVKKITLPAQLKMSPSVWGRWRYVPSLGKFAFLAVPQEKLQLWTPPLS
jgi:hypothetical protein